MGLGSITPRRSWQRLTPQAAQAISKSVTGTTSPQRVHWPWRVNRQHGRFHERLFLFRLPGHQPDGGGVVRVDGLLDRLQRALLEDQPAVVGDQEFLFV